MSDGCIDRDAEEVLESTGLGFVSDYVIRAANRYSSGQIGDGEKKALSGARRFFEKVERGREIVDTLELEADAPAFVRAYNRYLSIANRIYGRASVERADACERMKDTVITMIKSEPVDAAKVGEVKRFFEALSEDTHDETRAYLSRSGRT